MEPRYFHGGVIAGVHYLTASLSTPSEFSAGLGLIPSLQAVVEPRYFHEEIITGFQSLPDDLGQIIRFVIHNAQIGRLGTRQCTLRRHRIAVAVPDLPRAGSALRRDEG